MKRLAHKICLITGAARGIGQAIAELFHKEGAVVIITDIKDEEGLQFSQSLADRNEYLHLDVKKEEDWQKAYAYMALNS